jgi:SAM-dependent methyltransferase
MTKLDPIEEATRAAYDNQAKIWASEHDDPDYWADELRHFQRLLPTGLLLEVGCGGGRDANQLIKHGYRYIGTDVSAGLLHVAQKNLPDEQFYQQSLYELGLPNHQPFDGFWASAVLLHIPRYRIDEALQGLKRVLRPGAVGFITLKDGLGQETVIEPTSSGPFERFFCYWQKDDFAPVLTRNGYTVVDYHFSVRSERTRWHCFFVQV